MLKQRVITGALFAALLALAIIYLPASGLALLLLLIIGIGAWEWSRLAGLQQYGSRSAYVIAFLALIAVIYGFSNAPSSLHLMPLKVSLNTCFTLTQLLTAACCCWAVALLWVKTYPASVVLWRARWIKILMGFIVLVPTWYALMMIRQMEHGIALLFILLGIVTAADTGAYFSGRQWGKAKLAPNVSPGKSWAGFWGGLVASTLFCLVIWWQWPSFNLRLPQVIMLGLLTALASVLGDLLESMVKRQAGIKDSGNLLPGHGGFMDRMDSMTAAAPIFALILAVVQ